MHPDFSGLLHEELGYCAVSCWLRFAQLQATYDDDLLTTPLNAKDCVDDAFQTTFCLLEDPPAGAIRQRLCITQVVVAAMLSAVS